jgi:CHASE2 domain-containing sensor protein
MESRPPVGPSHRRASNALWIFAAAVVTGSLVAASRSCSLWHHAGAFLAAGLVAAAVILAAYLRQREPDTTLAVVFSLAVGVAAGICTFYGVLFCSLGFAHCG